LSLVFLLLCAFVDYRLAVPGYRYQFPRDHFNHPDFRTSGGITPAMSTRATGIATDSS